MKTDHSFTLTAAVVLAGVVLAFATPAEANEGNRGESHAVVSAAAPAATMTGIDAAAASAGAGHRKGSCERAKRAERTSAS